MTEKAAPKVETSLQSPAPETSREDPLRRLIPRRSLANWEPDEDLRETVTEALRPERHPR